MPLIETWQQVLAIQPDPSRALLSATHEEILSGATADAYFVKTIETLRAAGREQTPVVAEVWSRNGGILAGVEEVLGLLGRAPVEVEALDDGQAFESGEVLMRLRGPYATFGIYETALLGILACWSGWATAALACRRAAGDLPVICFGSRHVHPAVAPVMELAALIGGVDGASNILAARLADREPFGSMPHALVLILGDTVTAARIYDQVLPTGQRRTVLVDTFRDEAEEALRVAAALGDRLGGVRLDTPSERGGVTPGLVREVRARLDQAGFGHVQVFVSGGVTPERIGALAAAGAQGFGVGSYISSAPPIDMTMDLKQVDGRPIAKRGRIPGLTPSPRLRLRKHGAWHSTTPAVETGGR